jgi:hypothetical protein
VARTRDRGQTWTTVTLGSTTRGTSGRKDAGVGVAAIGRLVVVSWISSATGIVKARSSIDGGATWGATGTIASGADPGTATSAAAMTGWVAVAFIDGSAVRFAYRMSYGGSWTGTGTVKAGPAYLGIESVAIGYIDHYTLGAAMVACRVSCSRVSPSYAADIVWREQEDGGTYWHGANILASTGPDTTAVGSPSVVVASSTLRFVTAAMRATSTGRDRLVIRAGYGRP